MCEKRFLQLYIDTCVNEFGIPWEAISVDADVGQRRLVF